MTTMINLIVNALAIIINGLITISLIRLVDSVYSLDTFLLTYLKPLGITTVSKEHLPFIITAFLMTFLVMLSFTPIVDFFLRFIYGFRKPLNDEKEKLDRLLKSVCHSINKNPDDFRVFIVDEQYPNAYALGKNNIAVGRKLLKHFTDDEIKGVIAHELGHLHYNDTLHTRVFITVSLLGQIALFLYRFIVRALIVLGRIPIPFVNLFLLIITWGINLQIWIIEIFLVLPLTFCAMFGFRKNEYRADRYAYEVGYGTGLYKFLYRVLDMKSEKNNGLYNILLASHPKTGNRIRKLEDAQSKGLLSLS